MEEERKIECLGKEEIGGKTYFLMKKGWCKWYEAEHTTDTAPGSRLQDIVPLPGKSIPRTPESSLEREKRQAEAQAARPVIVIDRSRILETAKQYCPWCFQNTLTIFQNTSTGAEYYLCLNEKCGYARTSVRAELGPRAQAWGMKNVPKMLRESRNKETLPAMKPLAKMFKEAKSDPETGRKPFGFKGDILRTLREEHAKAVGKTAVGEKTKPGIGAVNGAVDGLKKSRFFFERAEKWLGIIVDDLGNKPRPDRVEKRVRDFALLSQKRIGMGIEKFESVARSIITRIDRVLAEKLCREMSRKAEERDFLWIYETISLTEACVRKMEKNEYGETLAVCKELRIAIEGR